MADPVAGQLVRADDFSNPKYIKKAASQSVTSSTVKVADNDFVVALPVGDFEIRTYLNVNGADAGDISINWVNTGTMTVSKQGHGPGTSSTTMGNQETVQMQGIAVGSSLAYGTDSGGAVAVWEQLLVQVTVTGTLTMQWAQGTSDPTATTITGSSRMMITRVKVF